MSVGESALAADVPDWFDPQLLGALRAKRSRRRGRLHFLDGLIFRLLDLGRRWHGFHFTRHYTWSDVESMIREDCATIRDAGVRPDLVVGIRHGGAFIANFVERQLGTLPVRYVAVVHYPPLLGSMLLAFLARSFLAARIETPDDGVDVDGRHVLLVDDQVCTGRSLALARRWLLDHGAAAVTTYCLLAQHGYGVHGPEIEVDFGGRRGVLIYAPWGDDP